METEGLFAPDSAHDARERYAAVEPAAAAATKEVAMALELDRETYRERVDEDVVLTAHEAIFASLLAVTVGTRDEFERWRDGNDREVTVLGSEHVSGVAWHDPGVADRAIAATFEAKPEAAVGALRRQAFAKIYREVVR